MKLYAVFEIRNDTAENENVFELTPLKTSFTSGREIGLFDNYEDARELLDTEKNENCDYMNEDCEEDMYMTFEDDIIDKFGNYIRQYYIKEFDVELKIENKGE